MSMASFVFQTFVVIEFLLHNSYPVVCSVVLCQAGSLFFLPVLLFFDTLKDSDDSFIKKESLPLSAGIFLKIELVTFQKTSTPTHRALPGGLLESMKKDLLDKLMSLKF